MLNKLALRNAGRLWKDYLNYFLTLCMITALMFSFHSLLFSKDIYEMICYGNNGELSTAGTMLITFMSVSTAVVLGVTGWLIHYMMRFILEKRSREFAIYLLAGMPKKQMAGLYVKENLFLGATAFGTGIFLGGGLRTVLFFLFYKSIGKSYKLVGQNFKSYPPSVLLTAFLFVVCFGMALFRNKKNFSRMEIIGLLQMDRQNERVNEKRNQLWRRLFLLSIGNVLFLYFLIFTGRITKGTAAVEMIGMAVTFYVFWLGLSAFGTAYIKGKGRLLYKRENLFLWRQFSSKIRNTCFVLGTLSLLFLFALTGSSFAFMLSDYQNKQLEAEYPFDVIMISDDTEENFSEEETLIGETTDVKKILKYTVYQNGISDMGDYLYRNLSLFSDRDSDPFLAEGRREIAYYDYDVYMGITDYNRLREMLGLKRVVLRDDQYLIHMSNRVYREIMEKDDRPENGLHTGLDFAGIRTEGFAQNGHNGTDCLLVVPDWKLAGMKPYFSLMAVMANGDVPESLSERLYELAGKTRGYDELADFIKIGSEELFLMPASIQVKSREVLELKFLMSTLSFPLFYIGLVFLCVSFTVLSVQQISDSHKYKFRYRILYRLGVGKRQIEKLLAKQMFLYYLCPVLLAAAVSAALVLYVGLQFVAHTGIRTAGGMYFGVSCGGFLSVYVLYFGLTYVQCRREGW